MEPILSSSAAAVIRTTAAAQEGDLSAVLRQGRVLVGEVLQASPGGELLLAIGRYRVPAQSDVRLEAGEHLLLRVAASDDGIELLVLGDAGEEDRKSVV